MSTQQDIYAAGSESHPPMLNKENYVPWSSRLLRYAKSRPNGKLIHSSLLNGPYVRRMIPEPGDANREVKEKNAKLFNEWEMFTSNEGESIESYYHRFLKLMNDLKRNKHFPEKTASNLKFLNNLQPEWSRHVTIVHQTKDLHIADYTQLYDSLKYNQKEYVGQNARNLARYNDVMGNQNQIGNGNLVAARAEENAAGQNGNQIRCYNCRGVGIQLQAEEYDLMAATAYLDEIEEVNANCILMANLQQASTPGTQSDNAPVYDTDGSAEEEAKFVEDFKSLANKADASLAKHKALELKIERLLKAVASDQKDNIQDTSENTKFTKQPIVENLPKVGETNALAKPITSNSVSTPQESKGVNNDKVIAPGMFRINPFKTSREEKHVPNTVNASARTKLITVSQPPVITKKDVNSDLNGLSSTGVDNTKTRRPQPRSNTKHDRVIQICLWCVDSGCFKHMTRNLKLLINFVWKFMGTVRFGNDRVAAILGFGQFCDFDLEVAFRRDACFVRNLEGVDLLKGDRLTNLYTINLHEMASASPICLMARASSTKSWLWHQRLSHINFDTINDLARNDLVSDLPKFKYHKEHICPSCEQGKSKRASHPPKLVPNSRQRLHLLHMDLCGPMRIASINGKQYVWITVLLQSPVIIIRTDNGTKFKNQVLKEYFDSVGISHQMSSVRTPQQNGVLERRNQTLVEAARTMLIFSHAPLFLWAEAIATVCFTQNRSIFHRRFNKTPYELINGRKPDISFLHVFGALCYPKNDREDIGKLGAKGDIGFFIGYSADSCASKPGLQSMTSGQISSGLDLTYAPSTIIMQQPSEGELDLLFEAMYDDYISGQPSATGRTIPPAQEPQ
nr:hypothetical protein [Tanacetum cinerariifolium]